MRIWPDTLPGAIQLGYGISPADQSIRTDMDVGTRRLRRISAARRDSVELTWTFNDAEMVVFRSWFGDEPVSIAGDSDDLSGWLHPGATIDADAVLGPDEALADAIIEDTSTSEHRVQLALGDAALATTQILCRATLKAAGRSWARLRLLNRAGQYCYTDIDLATGALSAQANLVSRAVETRGDGWWRVTIVAEASSGAQNPGLAVILMSAAATLDYTGDGVSAVAACEVQARLVTGYDLFVRSGADGNALGAAGGSAWVLMPLAFGGGLRWVEARFEEPWSARILPGLGWQVRGKMEVRNA